MTSEPQTVTSADGTLIALDEIGHGPPVVLIGGAFNERSTVARRRRRWLPTSPESPTTGADVGARSQALVEQGHRDGAVTLFLTEQVAVPLEMGQVMRSSQPLWGWLTGLAHTLPYDVAVCGPGLALPADRLATIAPDARRRP